MPMKADMRSRLEEALGGLFTDEELLAQDRVRRVTTPAGRVRADAVVGRLRPETIPSIDADMVGVVEGSGTVEDALNDMANSVPTAASTTSITMTATPTGESTELSAAANFGTTAGTVAEGSHTHAGSIGAGVAEVVGNGTDQTAELRAALQAAEASSTQKTVRFVGTVRITPHLYTAADSAVPYVADGCTLEGVGWSSCLEWITAGMTTAVQAWYGVRYGPNTTMRNFRMDGQRAAANRTGWTNVSAAGLYAKANELDNVSFENLWIHDTVAMTTREGFGIAEGNGQTNSRYLNVRAYDNDGTGIGTAGHYVLDALHGTSYYVRGRRAFFHNCQAWGNGWMGYSISGTELVEMVGCDAWDNADAGFNVEWSSVNLHGCRTWDNANYGLRGFGPVKIRAWGYHGKDNGAAAPTVSAEVALQVGGQAPAVEGDPVVDYRAEGSIELFDPVLEPPSGVSHIRQMMTTLPTVGRTAHDLIRVVGPDTAAWTISANNTVGGKLTTGIRLDGLPTGDTLIIGPLSGWWRTANGFTAAYVGGGNLGPAPQTWSTTADFQQFNSDTLATLTAGVQYLVRGRVKVLEAKRWALWRGNAAGGSNVELLRFPQGANDVGQWFTFDLLVKHPGAAGKLFFYTDADLTNSIVVDFVSITRVSLVPGDGEA